MVSQYPDMMHHEVVTEMSTQDEQGNWQSAAPTYTNWECRAEPNGSNGNIKGEGGDLIRYEWIVYMPPVSPIPVGTAVEIEHQGEVIKGTVKRFYQGQLNCRLWL